MKTVIEIDEKLMSRIVEDLGVIKSALQQMGSIAPKKHLTLPEFMKEIKCSRWKVEMLINGGLLEYRKIGRKFYIPETQVARYFAGELENEK